MEENEDYPVLLACRLPLDPKFARLKKVVITSRNFTLGRGLSNSVIIPFLTISRKHCTFKKNGDNDWYLEDHSSAGIKINDVRVGQGSRKKLEHEDVIALEPSDEFFFKFTFPTLDVFETPRKRMKMADSSTDLTIINDVKLKFEESQKCEIQHIEDKIQNAKQMQTTSIIHKKQLQEDMNRKIQQLEDEFSVQIENLKGEKNEVEKQKAALIEERDAQLLNVKNEMEGKIKELMQLISRHNETEFELLKENGSLKGKLQKEREDFLSELHRESSSKQDMLDKLEAKIREQEEVRLKEKRELEDTLRRETEQLRLAKEKELKEMSELKHQREIELQQELNNIKKNLAEQVKQTEQQRIRSQQELNLQMEQMSKLQAEEKAKVEQFVKEKEEILQKLTEAQSNALKSQVEVQERVNKRETELAALAAERIQNQVDQSSEVISTLQDQLEKVKSQLQTVETEKNTLLENISMDLPAEGTSKDKTLNEFGELMESELQCSICAELFVEANTLNCSHTFCKYCITMWKKKKNDCPICRAPIMSQCKSLVLDSFIEKMVQNLTEEMKTKRENMLKFRAEEEARYSRPATTSNSRKRRRTTTTTTRMSTRTTITTASGTGSTGATTASRPIQTVDLTMMPAPLSPAERPPLLPAQMVLLRPPLQPSRQIPIVDLTTSPISQLATGFRQIAIPSTEVRHQMSTPRVIGQITTNQTTRPPATEFRQISTGVHQIAIPLTEVLQISTPTVAGSTTGSQRTRPPPPAMSHSHQQGHRIQTENLTMRRQGQTLDLQMPNQIPTDATRTSQIATDPTGSPQISIAGGPTPSISSNLTEMLRLHQDQIDLMITTIGQMPACDRPMSNASQTATGPTDVRQTENLTTRQFQTVDQRPAINQIPRGDRQRYATRTGQNTTIPTGGRQISTVAGPRQPISLNPTERLPAMQVHSHQQGHLIATEGQMTPQAQPVEPTNCPVSSRTPPTDIRQIMIANPTERTRIITEQVLPVMATPEGGAAMSRELTVPTMAATDAASRAAPAATGPPAAPSDNKNGSS